MAQASMSFDTAFLLKTDPHRAYAMATLAAAQNDAATIGAFLSDGLDPASTAHKSTARGERRSFIHCPWIAAVQNDAVDVMRAVLEAKTKIAPISRLMKIKPYGLNATQTALSLDAEGALALFIEFGAQSDPIDPGASLRLPGEGRPLLFAAARGKEGFARWLAAPTRRRASLLDHEGFVHHLAAGGCANLLREALAAHPQAADARLGGLPLGTDWPESGALAFDSGKVRAIFANVANQTEWGSRGFSPLDWALWRGRVDALPPLLAALPPKALDGRVGLWLGARQDLADAISVCGFNSQVMSDALARLGRFMAFCEHLLIGGALVDASALAERPVEAKPRGLRL
jgi:hypothetical protein